MTSQDGPSSRPLKELEDSAPTAASAPAPHSLPLDATRLLPEEQGRLDPVAATGRSWPLRLLLAGSGLLVGGLLTLLAEDLLNRALDGGSYLAWIGIAGLFLVTPGLLVGFVREWR